MATKRMAPADRKEQLLQAAIRVAEQKGYSKINRLMIVEELQGEVTDGLVSRYFGQRANLRETVRREALARNNPTILAQALALGDKSAKHIDKLNPHPTPPEVIQSWKEFLGA
mgnify:CR=1 FL=1